MIYPGTKAYKWAKEGGYVITEDYSKWLDEEGQHNTNISRPDLTNKELISLCNTARKEFYLRPRYILKKLWQSIKDPSEGLRTIKASRTFFRHIGKTMVTD